MTSETTFKEYTAMRVRPKGEQSRDRKRPPAGCLTNSYGVATQSSDLPWEERAYEALDLAFIRAPLRVRVLVQEGKHAFIQTYKNRHTEGTAAKWLKFHSTCLFAKVMGQDEIPRSPDGLVVPDDALSSARGNGADVHGPREDDGCFCPGKIQTACKTVLKLYLATGKRRWRDVAYDVLMMKVGCPAVDERFVQAAYDNHYEALTKPRERVPDVTRREAIKKEINFLVDQVFAPKVIREGHLKERNAHVRQGDWCPSFRSSYDVGLSKGGAFRDLWEAYFKEQGDIAVTEGHDRVETIRCPELLAMSEVRPGEILEIRLCNRVDTVLGFQKWVDKVITDRLSSPLDVEPCAIKEPLKVRMVTKGQAPEYYRCLDFQKMMHTQLRRCPIFSLIGQPLNDEVFERAFGSIGPDLDCGRLSMVSGDYEAATDNLDPEMSVHCWDRICRASRRKDGSVLRFNPDGTDSTEYLLGRKALVGHQLHYPDGRVARQAWGQLMGSPMSFPILCLLNAACCRLAIGLDRLEGPLLINGDDCCFPATKGQYQEWEKLIAEIGLKKSVGKNYFSSHFAIINSEMRIRRKGSWRFEGWVNQSLLTGRERKGMNAGKDAAISFFDIGRNLGWVLEGIPSKHHERLVDLGIRLQDRFLRLAPRMCSWWIPRELGGLGIPCRSVEEKVLDGPYEFERRVIASYVCSGPEVAAQMPRTEVLKGPVAEAMSLLEQSIPKSWRSKEKTYAHPSVARNAGLHGSDMLGQLCSIPFTVDAWGQLEGVAPAGKLVKRWQKWVEPAIGLFRRFERQFEKDEEKAINELPFSLAEFDADFPRYPWANVITLPKGRSSRDLAVRSEQEAGLASLWNE